MIEQAKVIGPVKLPLQWSNRVQGCALRYMEFAGRRYLVVEIGDVDAKSPRQTLVRIQSACVLGDLFESRWCDCAWQLKEAKRLLFERGRGLLIHAYDQNGKGLSLENHFRVYADGQARDLELLTEAFDYLGFKYENRDYAEIGAILKEYYGIASLTLLTNDPARLKYFADTGFEVERAPLEAPVDRYNETELRIKRERFGHLLQL
jgi:GTP cyclohydrolase II